MTKGSSVGSQALMLVCSIWTVSLLQPGAGCLCSVLGSIRPALFSWVGQFHDNGKVAKANGQKPCLFATVGRQQRTSWLFQPSERCPLSGPPLSFFLMKWLSPSQSLSPLLASDLWVTMGPQTSHCLWGWRSGDSGEETPCLLLGTGKD